MDPPRPTESQHRIVKATHALRQPPQDAAFEIGLAEHLKQAYSPAALLDLYVRFDRGTGAVDALMRRTIWRIAARRVGKGLRLEPGVGFKHIETFEIGDGVLIGAQAYIQGRFDGTCRIGDRTWIGPQAYLDARDLEIGSDVGWGPGAKVLGSTHTGIPATAPITATDLEIKPVRIEDGVDIGTGAIILPGVRIGRNSMVGAGAVVTRDVPPNSVVAGVPARVLHLRRTNETAPP